MGQVSIQVSTLSPEASCVQVHYLSNYCTVNWIFVTHRFTVYVMSHTLSCTYQRHIVQNCNLSVSGVTKDQLCASTLPKQPLYSHMGFG